MGADASGWRALPFAQARFGAEMFALCRAVPYLDHLLCWLEETHGAVRGDSVVRTWQRALARTGSFEVWLHDRTVLLRSGRSVMLADKTVFFGVQGRADLLLAASRVGFGHPLSAVVLPRQRVVLHVHGADWAVTAAQAARAVARFAAHRPDCWADPLEPSPPRKLLVTGDANYAHHVWNQLGAVASLLDDGGELDVLATHQPIAPLHVIFADRPGLRVRPFAADRLPALDPMQSLPFPAGGTVVVAAVRERIGRLAERQASEPARRFVERMREQRRRPVWLSLRLHRTALNQQEALTELACALLANGACAIVFDGYSRPHDYAANPAYDKPRVERIIAGESALVGAVLGAIGRRLGPAALEAVLPANGWDLLDSVYLARQCAAYFANHGTLQHKIGYFTRVPGLVHANPAILASDRAAAVTHVIEDPGAVEYIDPSLVADAPAPGGAALHAENDYRFTDIPRLVATFLAFLERHGRDGR